MKRERERISREASRGSAPCSSDECASDCFALTWIVNTRSPLCGAAKDLKDGATCKSGKECSECIPPACK